MPRRPSNGQITDPYGTRVNPITGFTETHHGEDIGADAGLLLVAPEDATIAAYGVQPGWEVHGRVCILQGASGWVHWLSHTDHLAGGLGVGSRLVEGGVVAVMGLTGQTTGYHVHWETRWQGVRLDPEGWLASFAGADARPFTPIKKETPTMHAIRQAGVPDSGVIIRDTAAPYSLPESVFVATAQGLGIEIIDLPDWQYQTVIREQWSAHVADKTARGQGGQLDPLDQKQIAAAVRDALKGTTFTVNAS